MQWSGTGKAALAFSFPPRASSSNRSFAFAFELLTNRGCRCDSKTQLPQAQLTLQKYRLDLISIVDRQRTKLLYSPCLHLRAHVRDKWSLIPFGPRSLSYFTSSSPNGGGISHETIKVPAEPPVPQTGHIQAGPALRLSNFTAPCFKPIPRSEYALPSAASLVLRPATLHSH